MTRLQLILRFNLTKLKGFICTTGQNPDRQLADIELDETFTDFTSGKDRERPGLEACLKYCRKGDVLHIHSIDRLARNLGELQRIVDELKAKKVSVKFHKENLTFSGGDSSMDKLLLQIMGAFAEFERTLIRERQREGIAIAKSKGIRLGQPPKVTKNKREEIKKRAFQGEKIPALATEYGVSGSRGTIYNYIK